MQHTMFIILTAGMAGWLWYRTRVRMLADAVRFAHLPGADEFKQKLSTFTGYVLIIDALQYPDSHRLAETLSHTLATRGQTLLWADGHTVVDAEVLRRTRLEWIPALVAVHMGQAVAPPCLATPDKGRTERVDRYLAETQRLESRVIHSGQHAATP